MVAIILLLSLAVAALLLMAVCLYVLTFDRDRQLHVIASRLIAEQRIEHATRETLRAMRDTARQG